MKRAIGKGWGYRPPQPEERPVATATRTTRGVRVHSIPRTSFVYGYDLTEYESIFDYLQGRGLPVLRDHDGEEFVRLRPEDEERYHIHRDPNRGRVYAHRNARNILCTDLNETIWSYTTHANRDVIAWLPWRDETPARFDDIGAGVLTGATRPSRNATLSQSGERLYFRPLLGLLYVSQTYR